MSLIRSGPWKLMKFYEGSRLELYNVAADRGVEENLAQEKPKIRTRLHNQLARRLDENDAPMPQRRSQ